MHFSLPQKYSKRDAILFTLSKIPLGKVSTYGEVAKLAGFPGLARYVAKVLKDLPEKSEIPWHRVINSQGKISFPPDTKHYLIQRRKLEQEGICFSSKNTISKFYFW